MTTRIRASLRFTCSGPEEANQLQGSVDPDNDGYVASRIDGNELILESDAATVMSMRATLDDLLVCLSTADRVIGAGRPKE